MVNTNKLRGKMIEHGMNVEELSLALGMNRATFYRRLNSDGEEFSIREADMIVNILKLKKEEANAIFFSQFVA
ncbi:helix-turn-helix domain-containing protein [Blautia liquoris]|uniref:Helix-turn-helix domain-containing protein n=1 Tax=Blautia liquoris TaxID=2779518 RepID=A0A7M2RJR5_9FIRM|nr:helix-turn-helix transcriptional regulator [Blautia liquoris]QOV20545.1 helix-turn-helix domain-containing protein [Blautia liquoris]HAX53363.1 phage repressor protein [Lachnospiraceae bacterium]